MNNFTNIDPCRHIYRNVAKKAETLAINSLSYHQVDISQPWADQESCCSWPSPLSPSPRSGEPAMTLPAPTALLMDYPRPA